MTIHKAISGGYNPTAGTATGSFDLPSSPAPAVGDPLVLFIVSPGTSGTLSSVPAGWTVAGSGVIGTGSWLMLKRTGGWQTADGTSLSLTFIQAAGYIYIGCLLDQTVDADFGTPGTVTVRGGSSQDTIAAAAGATGQRMLVFSAEKSPTHTADPTVTSGTAVQEASQWNVAGSSPSAWIGSYTAAGGTAAQTIHYGTASLNGAAFQIPLVPAATSIRATASVARSNGTFSATPWSVTPVAGDRLFLLAFGQCGNSDFAGWGFTAPTGWTLVAHTTAVPTAGVAFGGVVAAAYTRVADGTPTDTATFTATADTGSLDYGLIGFALVGGGALGVAASTGASNVSPTVTPATGTDLQLAWAVLTDPAAKSAGFTQSPGMRLIVDAETTAHMSIHNIGGALAFTQLESGSATPTETWLYNGAATAANFASGAFTITLGSSATAAGSITLTGSGAAHVPGNTASGSISLNGSASSTAKAVQSGSILLTGSGAAGAPTVIDQQLHVEQTTMSVTARTNNVSTLRVAVSTVSGMTSPSFSSSATPDAQGYCTNVTVSGLTGNTQYFYRIEVDGALVRDVHGFLTKAPAGVPVNRSFAWGSCVATGGAFGTGVVNPDSFKSLLARVSPLTGRPVDLFAPLGDKSYPNNSGSPDGDYITDDPDVIRANIQLGLAGANIRALHAAIDTEDSWSDNDSGGGNCDAGSGAWPALTNGTSLLVWKQIFAYGTLPDPNANYRSKGDGRVLYIWTDDRTYSSAATTTDNGSKTKLGAAQRAWFINEIQTARARGYVQIVWFSEDLWVDTGTTSSPADAGLSTQNDGWGAYSTERTTIANAIVAADFGNQSFLSVCGDTHSILIDDGSHNMHGGFPIVCCAPFKQTANANGTGLTFSGGTYPAADQDGEYYGVGDIADDGTTLTVTVKCWDATASGGVSASDVQRGTTLVLTIVSATTSASGSISLFGSATARVPAKASGALTLTGSVTAKATVSAVGGVTLAGAAAGVALAPVSGAIALTGSAAASGVAPATASGSIAITGTAVVAARAVGTGSITLTATATAHTPSGAVGTITLAGTVEAATRAQAAGIITLAGTGATIINATAMGMITLTGTARSDSGQRDITVTIRVGRRRWHATVGSPRWAATLKEQP